MNTERNGARGTGFVSVSESASGSVLTARRDYKDTIFRRLFQDRENPAESVQCCKPHVVYGRGGFDGSHTGECGVHEHEKRCGFFAGQQAESL